MIFTYIFITGAAALILGFINRYNVLLYEHYPHLFFIDAMCILAVPLLFAMIDLQLALTFLTPFSAFVYALTVILTKDIKK